MDEKKKEITTEGQFASRKIIEFLEQQKKVLIFKANRENGKAGDPSMSEIEELFGSFCLGWKSKKSETRK